MSETTSFAATGYDDSSGSSKKDAAKSAAAETASTAKQEAAGVGQSAAQAGSQVASTAKEQGQQVVSEAAAQARDLLGEARSQATGQAGAQKEKAITSVRGIASELQSLANGEGGSNGIVTEFARQASTRLEEIASWVESREPADILHEVREFARRKPGTFLIGAAITGALLGRATRGTIAAAHEGSDDASQVSYPSSNSYVSPGVTYAPGTTGTLGTDTYATTTTGYADDMDRDLESVDVRPETTGVGYGVRP